MTRRDWKQGLLGLPGIVVSLLPKVACPLCWPAYAGLLSSIGLSFLLSSAYLLPLTVSFLTIAVVALGYRARQRRGYGPLLLGLAASGTILTTRFGLEFNTGIYVGIGLLVGASLWNTWPSNPTETLRRCGRRKESINTRNVKVKENTHGESKTQN